MSSPPADIPKALAASQGKPAEIPKALATSQGEPFPRECAAAPAPVPSVGIGSTAAPTWKTVSAKEEVDGSTSTLSPPNFDDAFSSPNEQPISSLEQALDIVGLGIERIKNDGIVLQACAARIAEGPYSALHLADIESAIYACINEVCNLQKSVDDICVESNADDRPTKVAAAVVAARHAENFVDWLEAAECFGHASNRCSQSLNPTSLTIDPDTCALACKEPCNPPPKLHDATMGQPLFWNERKDISYWQAMFTRVERASLEEGIPCVDRLNAQDKDDNEMPDTVGTDDAL